MHVTDLFPTLLKRAGVNVDAIEGLDGIDQWDMINNGVQNLRSEVVFTDDVLNYGMLRQGQYKLVQGTISYGLFDGWLSFKHINAKGSENAYAAKVLNSPAAIAIAGLPAHQSDPLTVEKILDLRAKAKIDCGKHASNICFLPFFSCLFDIKNDPCERHNLAWKLPGIKKDMLS